MIHPIVLPQIKVLTALIVFPLLYLVNSSTPWSRGLFVQLDRSCRRQFFISIHALHWTTTGGVLFWLLQNGNSAGDLGLDLDHALVGLVMFVALGILIATKLGDPASAQGHSTLTADQPIYRKIIDLLQPKTRIERFEHVALCVTAGFCEELLYRGFGILALLGLGCANWLAVCLTSLSFALIHGRAAFSPMGLYWVAKGMFYGALFLWSGSLLLVIALHALWDLALLLKRDSAAAIGTPIQ